MAGKCLLLLWLYASLCRAQLATTDDGSQILLTTFWRLSGEPFESGHYGIYRSAANRWTPLTHTDRGPVLTRPFLSADGSIAAWDRSLPCTGSCMLAIPRVVTEFQGVTPPAALGTYNLTFSRNARFLVAPGFMGFQDFVLFDAATGRQWTTPEVPILRALGVANTGAVIGLAATREGSFSNPVVPNHAVVWRPTGESVEIFQASAITHSAISADGARALIEASPGGPQARELWWIDIATQSRIRIAQLAPDGKLNFGEPANSHLSNDGSRALYVWPSQNDVLWLWQAGAEARVLAHADEGFLNAVLSGDGRIVWALTATGRLLRIGVDGASEEVLPALPPRLDYGYTGTAPGSAMLWRAQGGITPGLHFTAGGLTYPVIDESARDSIAIQIPWEAPADTAPLLVQRAGDPFELALAAGIEIAVRPVIAGATDARGDYWIKAAQQDFGSLVTPESPAPAGSTIHTWLYNLGPLDRQVATGEPGPADPPAKPLAPLGCFLLSAPGTPGRALEIPFLAYAPGLVGVYQADIAIPADWPSGKAFLVCDSRGVAAVALLPIAAAQ
ncbi:MAG: hypothetical protein ABI806_05420 [Candidatus Solibacter sp.]